MDPSLLMTGPVREEGENLNRLSSIIRRADATSYCATVGRLS